LQRDGKSTSDKTRLQILLFIRISDKTHCRTMFFKARKVSQLPSSRTLANAAMVDYIRPVYQVEERMKALTHVSWRSRWSLQSSRVSIRDATSWVFACLWRCAQNTAMKFLDPDTECAVRTFLARLPAELRLQYPILYGSRVRGEDRPDRDDDLALILAEGEGDWQLVGNLAELACDVFLERGVLIQPVPISLRHWLNPERFPRPGFLRNVARDGIVL
jgi:hypothetical protein